MAVRRTITVAITQEQDDLIRACLRSRYAENAVLGNGYLRPGMQVLTKPFVLETLASRIKDLTAAS